VRQRAWWAILAAAVLAPAGCNGQRETLLRGSPPIPARDDGFRYESLVRPDGLGGRRSAPKQPAQRRDPEPDLRASAPADPAWLPTVAERRWRWVVVHHSATRCGSAALFDEWHRNGRHWDELGYHFVIGNGTLTPDGLIEVGSRWFKQKHGAHCKVEGAPEYNEVGIGICLVGNFSEVPPSDLQMASLARLVAWLSGRYGIAEDRVIGHGDVKDTDCPGRHFSFESLRERVRAIRQSRGPAVARP